MAKARTSVKTYKLVLCAIMVALSTLLSFVQVYTLPMGGSITLFSMVPVVTVSWLFGLPWGLVSGFVFSILEMLFGLNNFSFVQGVGSYLILVLADYLVPFTMLGLAGMFKGKIKNKYFAFGLGTFIVCFIRFLCHFVSGVTIWSGYAPSTAMKAVVIYSLTYNGSYMLAETILTVVGALLVQRFVFPRLDENGMVRSRPASAEKKQ